MVLPALLVHRQNQTSLAGSSWVRSTTSSTAVADRGTADVVDVVHGRDAIRQRFEQLQLAARHEVMAFVKAPAAVVSTAQNTAEDEAVARGVHYRVLLEREMLDVEPGMFEQLAGAIAAGEEIRVTDFLPLKLLVVDHDSRWCP